MSGVSGPRRPWRDARVVLGVTGGIAAYKTVQVARDLTRLGARVHVVTTPAAEHFVGATTFEAVTGRPVHGRIFDDSGTRRAPDLPDGVATHLALGAEADVVCVAPATADFLARAAAGLADDLLTTTLLATRAPVVVCPAMNDRMYGHPRVQRNLALVRDELGYQVVGPALGPLAYGEGEGPGRMVEPEEIVEHVGRALGEKEPFLGRTVLVTAGPTREPMDPVRYLGNRSSGKTGFAVARAAWRRGAEVILVTGPVALPDPVGARVVRVETAREMDAAVRTHLPHADLAVFAAAVSDWRPTEARETKMKRSDEGETPVVELTATPDVAAGSRDLRREGAVTVGFALETSDLLENAAGKLEAKDFDLVVANAPGEETGFEAETNRVTLVGAGVEPRELPLLPKDEVAERILDEVEPRLGGAASGAAE